MTDDGATFSEGAEFSEGADHPTGTQPASAPLQRARLPDPEALKRASLEAADAPDTARDDASSACANCGADVDGAYCSSCGQRVQSRVRPLRQLGRELLEDLLELDLRTVRTIPALLFRPGHLTRAYVDGRRRRYVRPLRLYLFASFLLFTLLSLQGAADTLTVSVSADDGAVYVGSSMKLPETAADSTGPITSRSTANEPAVDSTVDSTSERPAHIQNEEPDAPSEMTMEMAFADSTTEREIGERFRKNVQRAAKDPGVLVGAVIERMPVMMFLLLPVFALLLKLAYLRHGRLYVEHLVFSLHVHAFTFLAFAISLIPAYWDGGVAEGAALLIRVLPLAYFYVALHRVYGQSATVSVAKATGVLFAYTLLYNVALAILTAATLFLL